MNKKNPSQKIQSVSLGLLPETWESDISGAKHPTTQGEPVSRFLNKKNGLNINLEEARKNLPWVRGRQ